MKYGNNYKLAQFLLNDPRQALTSGEILVQPSPTGEGGDLLIALESKGNWANDQELCRLFLETALESYRQSELHQAEKKLENILNALNLRLPAWLAEAAKNKPLSLNKKERIVKGLKGLNCFVGLLEQNQLYFSAHGQMHIFLIRPALIKKIFAADALPAAAGKAAEAETDKTLFDSTVSGSLKPGDRLLIANQSVLDYLSLEKIKKIAAALPPQSAVAHLSNILEAAPKTASFFCLIVQLLAVSDQVGPAAKIQPITAMASAGSKKSLDQMLLTQAETERILTPPSLWQIIKTKAKAVLEQSKKTAAAANGVKKTAGPAKQPPVQLKNRWKIPLWQWRWPVWLKTVVRLIFRPLAFCWLVIFDGRERYWLLKKISGQISNLIQRYNRLPKSHRAIFIGVVVLALIFSESLIWQARQADKIALNQKHRAISNQINEKRASIEAALIYDDLGRARELLAEIEQLQTVLPQSTNEQIAAAQKIIKESSGLKARIWKIVAIAQPVSLINFREINLTAEIKSLSRKDNYLFAFTDQNQIMAVNTGNANALQLENFNLLFKAADFFPKINNLVMVAVGNNFFTLDNNQLRPVNVRLPAALEQVNNLVFYLDKMYLLDKTVGQIFRLTYSGGEFGSAKAWLKPEAAGPSQAHDFVSLAIDGFIYGLKADGSIVKLSGGLIEDELQPKIEPAFASASKISTTDRTNNLYILDPANQRLVVLNKDGELQVQYHSDKFNNLKDFIVAEDEKKIYLLNGSQILVIATQ